MQSPNYLPPLSTALPELLSTIDWHPLWLGLLSFAASQWPFYWPDWGSPCPILVTFNFAVIILLKYISHQGSSLFKYIKLSVSFRKVKKQQNHYKPTHYRILTKTF